MEQELFDGRKRLILDKINKNLIKPNPKLRTFAALKKYFITCLVKQNLIEVIKDPPKVEIEYESISDEDVGGIFDDFESDEDTDIGMYYEQDEFKPSVKQFEQMSLSTGRGGTIEQPLSKKDERIQTLLNWNKWDSNTERIKAQGIEEIRDVIGRLRLNETIAEQAVEIWKLQLDNLNQGDIIERDWMAWSVLYTLNELNRQDYPAKTIMDLFNIKRDKLKKYPIWVNVNKNFLPEPSQDIQQTKFCNFDLTLQEQSQLKDYIRIINEMELMPSVLEDKKALSALMWWYFNDVKKEKLTKKTLRDKCGSTFDSTVNIYYQTIKNNIQIF